MRPTAFRLLRHDRVAVRSLPVASVLAVAAAILLGSCASPTAPESRARTEAEGRIEDESTEPQDGEPSGLEEESGGAEEEDMSARTNRGSSSLDYPEARRAPHVDELHGTLVEDPYRWLEDPDSPETRRWIDAQNELTQAFLEKVPERATIRRRLAELWSHDAYGVPFREGDRYFFTKKEGLQDQAVLYTTTDLGEEPRLLVDPNRLSEDGTISASQYTPNDDGSLLAYSVSSGGSDWKEIRVRNVATGEDLDDRVEWVKFSRTSWSPDGRGFFYSRYDEPPEGESLQQANYYQKLFFHRLGTPQSEDRLIYERPDEKKWGFDGSVTEDGRYLVIHVWEGTSPKNGIFYLDLQESPNLRGGEEVIELLNEFDAAYDFIYNDGPLFYFRTDLDAPRGRVVAIDLRSPRRYEWHEVIPEKEATLESVHAIGGRLIALYLEDASNRVEVYGFTGDREYEVELPVLGSVSDLRGKHDQREFFYAFSSFNVPPTVYRHRLTDRESTVFRKPDLDVASEAFTVRQVFYESRDGTRVPMFLAHRKDLVLTPETPTYLYGYGGFDIPLTPRFSVSGLVWMEMGGLFAMPNLRGGGEYGEEWHQAGTRTRKQNVFDDFIAAAEWLIEKGYTSSSRLAISGRSNGGLLVGACMAQRPDLFGAALPAVGVLDMLRFHLFTIGAAWISDYGSPDDPEEFRALYAYSPYHNLKKGTRYPPTLITTADHDDRVVPAHSFKFAAALQHAHAGPDPVLIRIDTRAGHGAGKPTSKLIEEWTDNFSFLLAALDHELPSEFAPAEASSTGGAAPGPTR